MQKVWAKRRYFLIPLLVVGILGSIAYSYGFINLDFGETKTIVLQPYDDFPDSLVTVVENGIKAQYNFEVKVFKHIPMPKKNYYKTKGKIIRYDATAILKDMKLPIGAFKIVGLVTNDITKSEYESKSSSLLGNAKRGKHWAVVSTYRLSNFGTGKVQTTDLVKTTNHELGHLLGLEHCDKKRGCLMDSGARSAFNKDSGSFCFSCKEKLAEYLVK